MNFINGDGPVLNTSRNNQELTFLKLDTTIAKLHAEAPLDHQKQLILQVVVMPNKLTLKLDELDVLTIQLADNLGIPVFVEL